jgi:hypothetical protein
MGRWNGTIIRALPTAWSASARSAREFPGSLTGSSPSGFGSSSARAWWNVPTPPPPCRHYTLTAGGHSLAPVIESIAPLAVTWGASQIRGARRTAADNAAIESFFALLQKNVLNRRAWPTREELRIAIVTPPRTFDPGRIRAEHEALRDPSGLTTLSTRSCSSPYRLMVPPRPAVPIPGQAKRRTRCPATHAGLP